jgi:hypothetical protein
MAMKAYWVIIAATYVVTLVVVFTECQPFYKYWEVRWMDRLPKTTTGMGDFLLSDMESIY